jgi:hypothetical protein
VTFVTSRQRCLEDAHQLETEVAEVGHVNKPTPIHCVDEYSEERADDEFMASLAYIWSIQWE